MRRLTLLLVVLFLFVEGSYLYSQCGLMDEYQESERKFSFSLQTGVTLHTDYLVNEDYSWNGIGVNYFEAGLFYKITDKIELGATIGTDEFKVIGYRETKNISYQGDTTIGTHRSASLNSYTWLAGNLNYYFNDNYSAGIKVGAEQFAYYLSGNFGAQLFSSEDWGLNSIIQLSSRFAFDHSNFNTYQINFLFNVRFKPDLSGIF